MRIIKPSYEIIPQENGMDGIYKQIELCGRTCYKSGDKAKDGSAKPFVERMVNSKHLGMCEHGTIYLYVNFDPDFIGQSVMIERYRNNPYSKVINLGNDHYITTNYRVIVENGWYDDLDFMCEPKEWHERRVTVRFTTQIAVSREANRHRVDSIAEQSTRYCNYSKDKFGGEISINIPRWVESQGAGEVKFDDEKDFERLVSIIRTYKEWTPISKWWFANKVSEMMYLSLVGDDGMKPQDARAILPLDTNTELVHTAFVSDWRHFFDLRSKGTTGAPHPDIEILATPLYEDFKKQGLL